MRSLEKIIVLLGVTLLFENCKNNPTEPSEITESYFPLKVGNTWTYLTTNNDHDTALYTMTITGTVQKNGTIYYVLKSSPSELFFQDSILLRSDEKGDICIRRGNRESIVFKFSAPMDSSWWWWIDDSTVNRMTMFSNTDTVASPLGTFRNCLTMGQSYSTVGVIYTFSSGIGLVKSHSWAETEEWIGILSSYSLK